MLTLQLSALLIITFCLVNTCVLQDLNWPLTIIETIKIPLIRFNFILSIALSIQ